MPTRDQDKAITRIPGWLTPIDRTLILELLDASGDVVGTGDLAEIGVHLSKSAALIGTAGRPGEAFTVLDLFGSSADDLQNADENAAQYTALSLERFEAHYLTAHDTLPTVVQAASDEFCEHVRPGSLRFLHIDGSHLFEHVATDVRSARTALADDGIVVFDDIRSEHTPGVSAAVWQAVANSGLRPVVLSRNKFYGTWGDPAPYLDRLRGWLPRQDMQWETQHINGHDVLRVGTMASWVTLLVRAQLWWHERRSRTVTRRR